MTYDSNEELYMKTMYDTHTPSIKPIVRPGSHDVWKLRIESDIKKIEQLFYPFIITLAHPMIEYHSASANAYQACCASVENNDTFYGFLSAHNILNEPENVGQIYKFWFDIIILILDQRL